MDQLENIRENVLHGNKRVLIILNIRSAKWTCRKDYKSSW